MISIISAKSAVRKKLAWTMIVDAISRERGIDSPSKTNYEMMTSNLKPYFAEMPKNEKEWSVLIANLNTFLSFASTKAIDENIISYFLKKRACGLDVRDFFQERCSCQNSRLINFTKTEFKFEENNKEDNNNWNTN